jgi:hypothetical protein
LAILFTYAHRGSRVFVPVAVFNALMLLSVPSEAAITWSMCWAVSRSAGWRS